MRIALIGYGRMGRAVEEAAVARGHQVVLRLTSAENADGAGITAEQFRDVEIAFEFTRPEAVLANVERAAAAGVDLVVGTTGWYEGLARAREIMGRSETALLYAPNFSLGVQLFFRLARAAARMADGLEGYDAYVLEAHHRHKRDRPSGTARRLAELLLSELSAKRRWVHDSDSGAPDPADLEIAVLRAGENPGFHAVGLDGPDDQIEIRHQARGRGGFARGAVAAAEWVRGRHGLFTIEDMTTEVFGDIAGEVR